MDVLRHGWDCRWRAGGAVVRRSASLFGRGLLALASASALAQNTAPPALRLDIPHSNNPLRPYRATRVPSPNLANSARIDTLLRDGVLELSLKESIALALEDNLELAIAGYN